MLSNDYGDVVDDDHPEGDEEEGLPPHPIRDSPRGQLDEDVVPSDN